MVHSVPSDAVPPLGGVKAGRTEKLACDSAPALELLIEELEELLTLLELELELELVELLDTLLELELELDTELELLLMELELLILLELELVELELELVELLTLLLELDELELDELITLDEDEPTSFFAVAPDPVHAVSSAMAIIQTPCTRIDFPAADILGMYMVLSM